jgi:hypothetical protein
MEGAFSMQVRKIADALNMGHRFLRSIHLERDFNDPTALDSYVFTDFTKSCFSRILSGLRPESGQRAWRVTGDYGSGKSSFALTLAHSFAGHNGFPSRISRKMGFRHYGSSRLGFIPVLSTCSRRPLSMTILASLLDTLSRIYARGGRASLIHEIELLLHSKREPSEEQVISLLQKINAQIVADNKGKGILLILDELGKFLEYAANNPYNQDIFLLQRLAETASRSGNIPFVLICLLHQGFASYADILDISTQREWEKVAGRFEEVVFNQPADQIAELVAAALNVRTNMVPRAHVHLLRRSMKDVAMLGWYGSARGDRISDIASRLFPLHPTVLPVLVRIFRRFGQNERSLFSFLLSNEPFGLRAFAEAPLTGSTFFRLHNLYDYVRFSFGHRLSILSYRSHWNLIESLVDSFATRDELHIKVLKTIGILNLLNDYDIVPTEDAILCALADSQGVPAKKIHLTIQELRTEKRVLYDRGRSRGLCLWPHTSVDLEKAYEDARRAIDTPQRVSSLIKESLESRPIVARRHYIETGNLRHFEVRYCTVGELSVSLEQNTTDSDGVILLPLCETVEERKLALEFVKRPELKERPHWLIGVPQPLNNLASLVQEVQRWEWVSTNTLELNGDKFAREEVSRQRDASRSQLERRVQSCIGLKQLNGQMMIDWFHQGHALKIRDGRELLEELSRIFDETYNLAPHIHNELVNRRNLSSAAAAARMRLIERMFTDSHSEWLGMNPDKKPPEMSMYLSVLRNTGLHRRKDGIWCIGNPHHRIDKCRVLPVLRRIREIVQKKPDSRVNIGTLLEELRKPPYGVRDGLLPLFLTIFAIAHDKNIAFYKDGTFLRDLNGEAMLVLTKDPERFDIQYCKIEGVRAELFGQLLAVLEVKPSKDREIELLDVVKNLCIFVAQLPAYVVNTKRISPTAISVRDAILNAREPARLLFTDLPKACGYEPFPADTTAIKPVHVFVKTLKAALDDLRAAYPELQERLRRKLLEAFDLPGSFQQFRTVLAARAEQILLSVTEPNLRAFCLRLLDDNLPESDWLESLGSYLALKPPSKWHDAEEDAFNSELAQLAAKFHRVESIMFAGGKSPKNTVGVRLSITQANGKEHAQVFYFSADEEHQLRDVQEQFEALLTEDRRLGLVAASRAIWTALEKKGQQENE